MYVVASRITPVALLVPFRAIGNQSRPEIFDLTITTPEVLYDTVVEVDERVLLSRDGWANPVSTDCASCVTVSAVVETWPPPARCGMLRCNAPLSVDCTVAYLSSGPLREAVGSTGEPVLLERELDVDQARQQLQHVYDTGIRSVAIVCLHSYTFADHELALGDIARDIGFTQVSARCCVVCVR